MVSSVEMWTSFLEGLIHFVQVIYNFVDHLRRGLKASSPLR
ncbi:unnamed protein product [Tenebrio molitor]|nr:unnamed protein product [Tenebrio molitor]